MILIIDNYDSFTYNLFQYVGKYDEVLVKRNDEITIEEIKELNPKGIILSPGPGEPKDSGICKSVVEFFKGNIPILGVCLGHQAIGEVFGAKIIRAKRILHGKCSVISLEENKLFKDIEKTTEVMRYHSLIIDNNTMPDGLEVIAKTDKDEIMGIYHKEYKIYGVQFHPESIFTKEGEKMIKNFVEVICNDN